MADAPEARLRRLPTRRVPRLRRGAAHGDESARPNCSSKRSLREDRSILDLIDADYSFVNDRLAQHYGIEGVTGQEFRRVKLPANRGGILTQASILTLTSNPTRTAPVKRGKWVLEQILSTPAAPRHRPTLPPSPKRNA